MTQQVVFLTGASRGIGEATARVFVEGGAKVGLVARSEGAIADLAAQLGDNAMALPCDVADFAAVDAARSALEARFGPVTVLINNAAMLEPIAPMADVAPEDWARLMRVNVDGVFHGVRAMVPGMLARGGGTVLTVSSGAAHSALPGWSAYCASKAAVAMMTSSLHLEHGAAGIRAMGLSPGTVATQMQRDIKASGVGPVAEMDWEEHSPPEWPARALHWMASPAADAYCGQELHIRDDAVQAAIGAA